MPFWTDPNGACEGEAAELVFRLGNIRDSIEDGEEIDDVDVTGAAAAIEGVGGEFASYVILSELNEIVENHVIE